MKDTTPRIGLVLLAAGGSSRLGRPKQLLVFQGRTLLRRAAEEALAAGCHPVVIVLGAYADRLTREIADLPVLIAHNLAWRTGMGASIRTGVEVLTGSGLAVDGVVIAVCDQPFCDASVIHRLLAGHRRGEQRIIAASYAGVYGVPALFDATLVPELLALDGQEGARRVIENHRETILAVPFDAGAVDIDSPEDLTLLETTSPYSCRSASSRKASGTERRVSRATEA
jgi:molybdenum cofactor cytidylyltransferase